MQESEVKLKLTVFDLTCAEFSKMSWIQSQTSLKVGHFTHPRYVLSSSSSPNSLPNHGDYQKQSSSGNKLSPAVLFIIIILAVIFFVSGLLHLLVRFLLKQRSSGSESNNTYPEMPGSDAFQRQLQQLFRLHDSGLDQAFIDALPVFLYKDIMGLKEPFDCAVCLCEFSEEDKLTFLPACSHAFHIDCIDTWLLSNSTCPLCRASLYYTPGLPSENPVFDFEFESREAEDEFTANSASGGLKQPANQNDHRINSRRVFSVRLGKLKSSNIGEVERGEGETSSSNLDARRCFSMGSYQYVVADSDFKVSFCPTIRGASGAGTGTASSIKLAKGRNGQNENLMSEGDVEGKKINIRSKGESFSVSKIWQWSKKDKFQTSSETQLGSSSVAVSLPWTLNDRTQSTL